MSIPSGRIFAAKSSKENRFGKTAQRSAESSARTMFDHQRALVKMERADGVFKA
jgi:hypothetical protein